VLLLCLARSCSSHTSSSPAASAPSRSPFAVARCIPHAASERHPAIKRPIRWSKGDPKASQNTLTKPGAASRRVARRSSAERARAGTAPEQAQQIHTPTHTHTLTHGPTAFQAAMQQPEVGSALISPRPLFRPPDYLSPALTHHVLFRKPAL